MSTAGLVFAGGQSRRMGRDKALIELEGQPLIQRVLAALEPLDSAAIVGGDEQQLSAFGHRWYPDEHPGEGPLGALLSGMHRVDAEFVLSSACDLPHLDATTVRALIQSVSQSGAAAAVPLVGGRWQWHVAAWSPRAIEPLERAFKDGERSLNRAAKALPLVAVVFADRQQFVDVDTPEDLEGQFPV